MQSSPWNTFAIGATKVWGAGLLSADAELDGIARAKSHGALGDARLWCDGSRPAYLLANTSVARHGKHISIMESKEYRTLVLRTAQVPVSHFLGGSNG